MSVVNIEYDESTRDFFAMLRNSGNAFRRELTLFLEGLGDEFLRLVEDEIIRRKVMDTRQLLASFHKGNTGNVWEIEEDGLVIEVGSTLNYAGFVNEGHWTNPKGVARRFVPGTWEGDRFVYDPSAEGGMLLKQHWVEGTFYWESALKILEKMLPSLLDEKLQAWIDNYFGE